MTHITKCINGKTKIFGLLGNPVEHTQSPFIHQLFYEATEFNGTYNPFFVPIGQLEQAILGMCGLSISGLNVTIPYKVDVMEYLDHVDPIAKAIGAVNTIVPVHGKLVGYNTDWIGLKMACDYYDIPIKGQECVIIGAGGAARGAVATCLEGQATSVTIINRTREKADRIKNDLQNMNMNIPIYVGGLDDLHLVKPNSVAIQTTSVGMHPHEDTSPIFNEEFFQKVDFIVDIIYNPKETVFMTQGREHQAKVLNGLSMLFFQALKAFEYWTDITLTASQIEWCLNQLEMTVYNNTKN
jgi:shikimate dehydrogenase